MAWEDLLIAAVNVAFTVVLLPTLLNRGSRVSLLSSAPIATGLALMVVAFAALGLWLTVGALLVQVVCWALLAVFRRMPNLRTAAVMKTRVINNADREAEERYLSLLVRQR